MLVPLLVRAVRASLVEQTEKLEEIILGVSRNVGVGNAVRIQPRRQGALHARVDHQKSGVTHIHLERRRIIRITDTIRGSRNRRRHPRALIRKSQWSECARTVLLPVVICVVVRPREGTRLIIRIRTVVCTHVRVKRRGKPRQVERVHDIRLIVRVHLVHPDPRTLLALVPRRVQAPRVRDSRVVVVRVRPIREHHDTHERRSEHHHHHSCRHSFRRRRRMGARASNATARVVHVGIGIFTM